MPASFSVGAEYRERGAISYGGTREFLRGDGTSMTDIGSLADEVAVNRGTVFERLSSTWERRAQVRSFRWESAPAWDAAKDDFLPQLLPFGDHPAFLAAPAGDRERCLAAAWLAFNENQVGFELAIVIP